MINHISVTLQQKQQENIDTSSSLRLIQNNMHYHSRHNSPQNITNTLAQNSKTSLIDTKSNNNNFYKNQQKQYLMQDESPYMNFQQMDFTYDESKNNIVTPSSLRSPMQANQIYMTQLFDMRLDEDKTMEGTTNLQYNNLKPNVFKIKEQLDQKYKGNIMSSIEESNGNVSQIKSSAISPHSVNSNDKNDFVFSGATTTKSNQKIPNDKKVLAFDDPQFSTTKKITQIRTPLLSQKSKPNIGFHFSQMKTPQSNQSESKYEGASPEYTVHPLTKTFEDTPQMIKLNKNVLFPSYPVLQSEVCSLLPSTVKTKNNSPKNSMNFQQNYYTSNPFELSNMPTSLKNSQQTYEFNSPPIQNKQEQQKENMKFNIYEFLNENNSSTKPSSVNQYEKQIENTQYKQDTQSISQILNNHIKSNQIAPTQESQKNITNFKDSSSLNEIKIVNHLNPKQIPSNQIIDSRNKRDLTNAYFESRRVATQANQQYDSFQVHNLSLNNQTNQKNSFQKHSSFHQNQTPQNPNNLDGYKKMIEFPKKKRELLEQQRLLIQQERDLLEQEKDLLDQEEEIFYESSQGQLTLQSQSRVSHNQSNINSNFRDQRSQSNNQNGHSQQENSIQPTATTNQVQQNSDQRQNKAQFQTQTEAINIENNYDRKIRESQQLQSDFLQKYSSHNNAQQNTQTQKTNVEESKQTPYYYTLNSLQNSKNIQNPTNQINQIDQVKDILSSQQYKNNSNQQSIHESSKGEESKKVEDILNYFKKKQDFSQQKEEETQIKNSQQQSSSKKKIVLPLPLPIKKELFQTNKQSSLTQQSPDRNGETMELDLKTPQKDNQKERELNSYIPSKNPSILQIENNNNQNHSTSKYLVKKKQIFSPMQVRYLTPNIGSNHKNEKYNNYQINPNKQENGIQVSENSFLEGRGSIKKSFDRYSPNTNGSMKKPSIPRSNEQQSQGIVYQPYRMQKQATPKSNSPLNQAQFQNEMFETEVIENQQPNKYTHQNKQLYQRPDSFEQPRYQRSISTPHYKVSQEPSIVYVDHKPPQQQRRQQNNDFLCFNCGDTQLSSDNKIILEALQDSQQNYKYNQPPQIYYQTPQVLPQQLILQNTQSFQPIQSNHLESIQIKQQAPERQQSNPVNLSSQEDQRAPSMVQALSILQSDCDTNKQRKKSPNKIFNAQLNKTLKTEQHQSFDKISIDPINCKNMKTEGSELSNNILNQLSLQDTSIIQNQNMNQNQNQNTSYISNNKTHLKSFLNSSTSSSYTFPRYAYNLNNNNNNNGLDFSYLNPSSNIQTMQNPQSDIFCDKCFEFISANRYHTHITVCNELIYFHQFDLQKQINVIDQKVLKISYLIKRKSTNASPIRNNQQNQNTSQQDNPAKQQNQSKQDTKFYNYCNYLHECLSILSRKTVSQQDFNQGKYDLKLIIQRLKTLQDTQNISDYGERAQDLIIMKEELLNKDNN